MGDLDLVELRCRLRGWEWSLSGLCVRHKGRTIVWHERHRGWCGDPDALAALTRPRLTLADLVASPPEGWTSEPINDSGARMFGWGTVPGNPDNGVSTYAAVVGIHNDGRLIEPPEYLTRDYEQLLAAHRAVAELLVLLGEVG